MVRYHFDPSDTMKLADWARQNGVDYKTAYRWFRANTLPVSAWQHPQTGTILVEKPTTTDSGGVALYARESSSDQRADLDRQIARLAKYAADQQMRVVDTVTEIGSGLNGQRKKLMRVLTNPKIGTVVVGHRDRLARFGSEYIESALAASGRTVVVVDNSEMQDDLVQDMIDVLRSFCARLYGRRAAKDRALRALEAAR